MTQPPDDSKPPATRAISLLITTYQQPRYLDIVLSTLNRMERPAHVDPDDMEIIICDDGSGPETRQVIEKWAPVLNAGRVEHVRGENRNNRSANRNRGIRASTGDVLIFLDGDCVPEPDFIQRHNALLKPESFVIAMCARLGQTESEQLQAGDVPPGLWDTCSPDELKNVARLRKRTDRHIRRGDVNKTALRAGNFSAYRSDIVAVNGFDERFVGWGQEDNDLGRRLIQAGLRPINAVGDAKATHIWHPSSPTRPKKWREGKNIAYFLRPGRLVYCRHGLTRRALSGMAVFMETLGIAEPEKRLAAAIRDILFEDGMTAFCPDKDRADIIIRIGGNRIIPTPCRPDQISVSVSFGSPGFFDTFSGAFKRTTWFISPHPPNAFPASVRGRVLPLSDDGGAIDPRDPTDRLKAAIRSALDKIG